MAEALGGALPGINWDAVPSGVARWQPEFDASSNRYGVSSALLAAIATAESGGDQYALSPAGAQGIMQIMPFNAGGQNLYDPQTNIDLGAQIIAGDIRAASGDLNQALQSYNGGSYRGPDTARYAATVLGYYQAYQAGAPTMVPLPPAPPAPDNSEAHWASVVPQTYQAFDALRTNVGNVLPDLYGQIVSFRNGLTFISGGGGRYQ